MADRKTMNHLMQGSKLAAFLFKFHWAVLIVSIGLFSFGKWKVGILFLVIAALCQFISYRLAGGRYNSVLYNRNKQSQQSNIEDRE